jgi:DNA-binding transcriptional ArsR family regulator
MEEHMATGVQSDRRLPVPVLPDDLPGFLRVAADPNRLRILTLLTRGEWCVSDIEAVVGLPQNLVSHHLSMLKRAGLAHNRRDGKRIYYRIEPQTLGEHLGALRTLLDTRQPAAVSPTARASADRKSMRG